MRNWTVSACVLRSTTLGLRAPLGTTDDAALVEADVAADSLITGGRAAVSFAIIRGSNGRHHEVDFGEDALALDVAASEGTVQITIEVVDDSIPLERRRFATLAVPRDRLVAALRAALGGSLRAGKQPLLQLIRNKAADGQ